MSSGSKNWLCKVVTRSSLKEGKQSVKRGYDRGGSLAQASKRKEQISEQTVRGGSSLPATGCYCHVANTVYASRAAIWIFVAPPTGPKRSFSCNTDPSLRSTRLRQKHSEHPKSGCVTARGAVYWAGGKTMRQNITTPS